VIATNDTTTPVDEQELIVASDNLLKSVPREDLTTVIDETAAAFDGAGDDIGRLLDNGQTMVDAGNASLPATLDLLRDGGTVLETQDDQAKLIRTYLADLADVTDVVADRDGQLRVVLKDGTRAARELRRLAEGLAPNLPVLLANTIQLSGILTHRLDQVEETLVAVPFALASAITPGRDRLAHFTFVGGFTPQPCRTGYIPANQWKSIHDPIPSVLSDDIGCRTASSVPRGVVGAPGKLAY
jgi:phospholipid/cholesterol/gamma-HCH transport system substrate-binding protein